VLYFYLDASAWAKRYLPENGSESVTFLLNTLERIAPQRLIVSAAGIAETIATINRRRSQVGVRTETYLQVVQGIRVNSRGFAYKITRDSDILDAVDLITKHNLNTSDALHLHLALAANKELVGSNLGTLAVVTSDQRLLRAAAAEGLAVLDPEVTTPLEIQQLLTAP